MPTLIIPPGYSQVTIPHQHSGFSRPAYVTFGIQQSGVPDSGTADDILAGFDSTLGGFLDDSVTTGPVTIRVGQDGGEALVVTGTDTAEGSKAGSVALNQGQALLVHKRTSRGGRRGRGRMYLPWYLDEGDVTDVGGINPASLASYNTALAAWLTALEALADVDAMVVLHSTGESTTGLPNVVTSLQADARVGTQRRRLGR